MGIIEKIESLEKVELMLLLRNARIIGVDIDGTLSDTISATLSEMHSRYGNILEFSDWKYWNPHEIRQLQEKGIHTIKQTIDIFYSILKKDGNQIVIPIPGSQGGIRTFKAMRKTLIALSGRMEGSCEYTKEWLEEHFGKVFDQVILTNHGASRKILKYDLAKQHGIELMIEDNAFCALEFAKHGIPTILLEAPWNIDIDVSLYPDIFRVKDWSEISRFL